MYLLQDLIKIAAIALLIISSVVSTPIPSNMEERIALNGNSKVLETRGTGGGGLSNAGYKLGKSIGAPIGKMLGPPLVKGLLKANVGKSKKLAKAGPNEAKKPAKAATKRAIDNADE